MQSIHVNMNGAQSAVSVFPGSTATVTISEEGTTTLTYFAVDDAGNKEKRKTITVQLDKTPPVIAGLPSACSLWPPNHKLVQVATVSATDKLSSLVSFTVDVSSNEADGDQPEFVVSGAPLQPQKVELRAERSGNGNGRVYTIKSQATDLAGNTTLSSSTCTVPHDQSRK